MKKILIISLLVIFPLMTSCGNNDQNLENICHCKQVENCQCKNMYQSIDYASAKKLLDYDNTYIIDVRSQTEYGSGHIKGAISIPLDQIENISLEKNSNLIIYCQSGNRSKSATLKLLDLGYVNVYDLGSINNWKE